MKKEINLKEQKRKASDARIMAAAIKLFGEQGYSHTSFAQIGKEAGVATSLAGRRFNTKKELFCTAYMRVVERNYPSGEKNIPVPEALHILIAETKLAREKDPEGFRLMKNVLTTTDLPEGCENMVEELFNSSYLKEAIIAAQEKGLVPKTNTFRIFLSFISSVFFQVDFAYTYKQHVPDDDYFFGSIRFVNQEKQRLIKQKETLLEALSSTFHSFVIVWPDKNKGEVLRAADLLKPYYNTNDVKATAAKIIESTVPLEDQESLREFLDMTTITERMGNKKNLVRHYMDIYGNHMMHILIPMQRAEDGRIIELLAGIKFIDK